MIINIVKQKQTYLQYSFNCVQGLRIGYYGLQEMAEIPTPPSELLQLRISVIPSANDFLLDRIAEQNRLFTINDILDVHWFTQTAIKVPDACCS